MLNWIAWNITVYMYKMGLALNNLQRLTHHKTKANETIYIIPSRKYTKNLSEIIPFFLKLFHEYSFANWIGDSLNPIHKYQSKTNENLNLKGTCMLIYRQNKIK